MYFLACGTSALRVKIHYSLVGTHWGHTSGARGNVELPLLLTRLGKAERKERALRALRVVGLEERSEHKPAELPGGEQQRVAIARAIVTDPDLVVADEPTGDLDARNAEAVLELLRELRTQFGKTVIMVTHDARAEKYVDEVIHLDKGVLIDPRTLRSAEHA